MLRTASSISAMKLQMLQSASQPLSEAVTDKARAMSCAPALCLCPRVRGCCGCSMLSTANISLTQLCHVHN